MPAKDVPDRRKHHPAWLAATLLILALGAALLLRALPPRLMLLYLSVAFAVLILLMGVILIRLQRQYIRLRQKMLTAAQTHQRMDEMRTRFLCAISHDVRTPLNTMIGLSVIAARHASNAAQQTRMKRIRLAGEHLLTLVSDILDVTRMESGKLPVTPKEMSLPDLFSQLISMTMPQMQDKHQHLEVHLKSIRHERLMNDPLRMSQIYLNLLTNAIKYTPPKGKILVEIWQDGAEPLLGFRITDSGPGMDADFMAQMYDAFERGTDAQVLSAPGTGMGLYIVRQLVELLDGTITCSSTPGEGTVFEVHLPMEPLPESPRTPPPLHLLLADASPETARLARNILTGLGMTVKTALHAPAVLREMQSAAAAESPFDAVILDRHLPGLQLSSLLPQLRHLMPPPRILLADFEGAETETSWAALGADGFISKLYFPGSVSRTLENAFSPPPPREESPEELAGLHLLIAEDIDINREILAEMLRFSGATCDQAVNGQICVQMLKKAGPNVYDAILMDRKMPVMDGLTAARTIRALDDPLLQNTPILAVSADAYPEDVDACLKAGMNGHLTKPITPEALVSAIKGVVAEGADQSL